MIDGSDPSRRSGFSYLPPRRAITTMCYGQISATRRLPFVSFSHDCHHPHVGRLHFVSTILHVSGRAKVMLHQIRTMRAAHQKCARQGMSADFARTSGRHPSPVRPPPSRHFLGLVGSGCRPPRPTVQCNTRRRTLAARPQRPPFHLSHLDSCRRALVVRTRASAFVQKLQL